MNGSAYDGCFRHKNSMFLRELINFQHSITEWVTRIDQACNPKTAEGDANAVHIRFFAMMCKYAFDTTVRLIIEYDYFV